MRKILCSVAPLGLALASAVSAQSQPMTLEDISRLSHVATASLSADGEHLAYIQTDPRIPFEEDDGPADTALYVRSGTEGDARPFVTGEINISQMAWSVDNTTLYFLAKRGPKPADGEHFNGLYRISTRGGEAQLVCQLETDIAGFALNPLDDRVALLHKPAPDKTRKELEKKGFTAVVYEESVKATGISLWDPDSGDCQENATRWSLDENIVSAQFSPDGRRLLASVTPTPLIDDNLMHQRLRVYDLGGKELERIDNLGKLGEYRWSPDSRHVAYIGVSDYNDPAAGRLKVARPGGDIRNLLPDLPGHVRDISWTRGSSIDVIVDLGVETQWWRVNAETGASSVVHDERGQILREIVSAPEGRGDFVVSDSASHPAELFRHTGDGLERLTDSNPWLAERRLGRQEVLNYKAKDGLDLQGLLVYPLDYREGRRYPLVVFVHGGPESHRRNGWSTNYGQPAQVMAGEGYFSFIPNYRGSTGKGVAFSKADQHAYATPEFDDIVDGKERLVEIGLVDADRVGITGGSYGGYATAWSATALSEHYAAGVMFVGISNQISKFGTTDIANEMYQVHSRAWPWEDWKWMLERSPIYHADKSRTPLLIMHGDADPRVHPSQSLEMYRYMKLQSQAPVRLVLYPGEAHGNKKAAAQYDYSRRLVRWMDHYLKGDGGEPPAYELDYSDKLEGEVLFARKEDR